MKKVIISKEDRFQYYVRDEAETIYLFGEDYLEEYGVEIPEELFNQYQETMFRFRHLQDQLQKLYQD